MRDFWRTTLAVILGLFLYSLLTSVLWLLLLINMAVSTTTGKKSIPKNTVLIINLDRPVEDKVLTENFPSFDNTQPLSLTDIKRAINYAEGDSRIKGILLSSRVITADWAQTEEIRKALQEFKKSGKFIIAYSDIYTHKNYYLSTVADKIYIKPTGSLLWLGLSAQVLYYKDLLDRLGVEPILIRHGEYKTAGEPFVRDSMSDANREQYAALLGRIWNNVLRATAETRGISAEELNRLADELSLRQSEDGVKYGLVDAQVYYNQLVDTLKALVGIPFNKKVPTIKISDYIKSINIPEGGKEKIAVVYAQGNIVDVSTGGYGLNNEIVGSRYVKLLYDLRNDPKIKAIVLRVNSPGGSGLASEQIWNEVHLTSQVKPIVVSMGGVAASGGYYISCPANVIVADSMTITGSIGVFGLLLNAHELMKDKLGINISVVKTNAYSDFSNFLRPMSQKEKEFLQDRVDNFYNRFISVVAEGRGLSVDYVDSIGRGRVWSAVDAKYLGLVDTLGDLDLAIHLAAEKAGVSSYRIVEYPKPKSWIELLLNNPTMVKSKVLNQNILAEFKALFDLEALFKQSDIWALMPRVDIQ